MSISRRSIGLLLVVALSLLEVTSAAAPNLALHPQGGPSTTLVASANPAPRRGGTRLVVGGSLLLAVPWWLTVWVTLFRQGFCFDSCSPGTGYEFEGLIPVAGPVLVVLQSGNPGTIAFYAADAIAQSAGLALLIAGIVVRHRAPTSPQVVFAPTFGTLGTGMQVVGRF